MRALQPVGGRSLIRGAWRGSLLGAAMGGGLGYLLVDRSRGEENSSIGTVAGGFAGVTLGAPLGAHLAGGRRGNYFLTTLASTGIGLAGAGLVALEVNALSVDPGTGGGGLVEIIGGATFGIIAVCGTAIATVIGQIKASAAVERATAAR